MPDKRRPVRSGLRLILAAEAADEANGADEAATTAGLAAQEPGAGPDPDQKPEDLEDLLRAKHGYQAAADAADAAKLPSLDDFVN
ncbi:MAG: hypothetical protein ABI912_03770 [Actinomycetota bacterium]